MHRVLVLNPRSRSKKIFAGIVDNIAALGLKPETVKTRLHRARHQLREALQATLANSLGDAFPFLGPRCDRIVETVMRRIESR